MSTGEVTPIRPEPAALEILRKPFDPKVVGKLPRVTCGACSKKNCQTHKPSKCATCGAWITTAHIHLDYVGHAEVTDRLLSADPAWNWEPLAWTEEGFPKFTKGASGELELWIKLTVCGVTRLGVGSVAGNAFDAEKQLIGDALRNAAMRFGVALDLWAKEELESQLPSEDESPKKRQPPKRETSPEPSPPPNVDAETGEVSAPRRRKPPAAAQLSDIEPGSEFDGPAPTGRDPVRTAATPEQVADITDVITGLKEAGGDWADKGRAAWKAAGLPPRAAHELTQDDAAKAFDVLSKVYVEASTQAQPTLDGAA